MAHLTVTGLRDLARETMIACGARGFMRFAREGDALLVTDAAARCQDGGEAMREALTLAGFRCRAEGALTLIASGDALLARLCESTGELAMDWESPLHPVQAFAARLMREEETALTDSGCSLVLMAARLLWQPQDKVLSGLTELRALAATRLREHDRNGFYQTGRLLANWCLEQEKGDDAR